MERLIGIIFILLATVLNALLIPLLKLVNQKVPTFTTMTIYAFYLFILSLLSSLLFEKGGTNFFNLDKKFFAFMFVIGVIYYLAIVFIFLSFKHLAVWQQTMFGLLIPILSGVFAYYILKEPLSYKLFVGLAIASFGLYIALR